MKTLKIVAVIVAVLVACIVGFLWYEGCFATIKPDEKEVGGYIVAGMDVTGPYAKAGQKISEVTGKLKSIGIHSDKGYGIYYDDPKVTPQDKCRSFVGLVIDRNDIVKIAQASINGLRIDSIRLAKAVYAEFPLRNKISYMMGPIVVYPAISHYMQVNNYKSSLSFEIYDMAEKKISFVMQYSEEPHKK